MSSQQNELIKHFRNGDLDKFQEILEVFQVDVNAVATSIDQSVFELILSTRDSSNYIDLCIENGADLFMVSFKALIA